MKRIPKIKTEVLLLILHLLSYGLVRCQGDMPKDCRQSLGANYDGSLPPDSFEATSWLNGNFTAGNGRLDSPFAWKPSAAATQKKTQQYLRVDLGQAMTITAVKTQGYLSSYVKTFKLRYSLDGGVSNFYQDEFGDKVFKGSSAALSMHILCPVVARYVSFFPLEFEKEIALRVDVFGCNQTFKVQMANISNLMQVYVEQNQITFSWSVSGEYDSQKVLFKKVGGDLLHKTIGKTTSNDYRETIKLLEPCTKYKITVAAFNKCKSRREDIFITTRPRQPGAPSIIEAKSIHPLSAYIKWKSAVNGPGCYAEVTSYIVEYSRPGSSPEVQMVQSNSYMNTSISGLTPWVKYRMTLIARTPIGNIRSSSVDVNIIGKAPEQPVTITDLRSETPTSFTVTWDEPPLNTVNGEIKGYAVFYRKLHESTWNSSHPTSLKTSATITSLKASNTYQVYVMLFNNLYNISSQYKEVFIARRDPVLSPALTKSLVLVPSLAQLTVQWEIPDGINVVDSDVVVVDIRKLGDKTWLQKNVTNVKTTSSVEFKDLQEWRIYQAKIKLLTKHGIFFTNTTIEMVRGRDKQSVVKLMSLKSKINGTVQLSLKVPYQYISNNLRVIAIIRWQRNGSSAISKTGAFPVASKVSSHNITGLKPWNVYSFQASIGLRLSRNSIFRDTSKVSRVMVVGDAPGKPPNSILASVRGPHSISISWHPIPAEYTSDLFTGYAVFLSVKNSTVPRFKHVNSSTRSVTFNDLQAETVYHFQVAGRRKKVYGPLSYDVSAKTSPVPRPLTPRLISAVSVSAHEIVVTWTSTVLSENKIENFTVVAVDKAGKKASSFYFNMKSEGDKRREKTYELRLKKLQPFTDYTIHVYASEVYRGSVMHSKDSNQFKITTKEAAPSEPINLKNKVIDGGILLMWSKPVRPNGRIRAYIIQLLNDRTKELVFEEEIAADKNSYAIRAELNPYTRYHVSLKAVTTHTGPAALLSFLTPEGFPGPPRDVVATRNGSDIVLKWKAPLEENGKIIQYEIRCGMKETDLKKSTVKQQRYHTWPTEHQLVLKDFDFGIKYSFKILAKTSKGFGPKSTPAYFYIALSKPNAPPLPFIIKEKIGSTTMVVKLTPSNDKDVSLYQVIVEQVNSAGIQRRAVKNIPDKISSYKNASKRGDRFYIAAEFIPDSLPPEFTVGDGKMYNGYYNAPLSPKTVYKVHVRVGMNNENGDFVFGFPSSIQTPATAPRKTEATPSRGIIPLPIIVGIAGALLILIILVVIIILYLRRSGSTRRQSGKQKKEPYDVELAHLRTKMDPGEQRPVSLTGDFPLHPDHPPITVSNYGKQIAKLHRSDNSGFRAEYYQLEMGKEFSWDVAHLPENKPKNRFANIVAYDHARVILTRIPGIPGSDYINASYIDGFLKPNAYIATQGPLPGTFNDFWRMIWELRSSVIVMLTNLQEKNKLKCHKYWPDDCIEYGEVIVSLTRKEQYADYVIRTFILERPDSQETREVKQFHFTVWPDHGVPRYATAILAFRRRVRAYAPPESGPTIVHCSAGVGRTGTYVALDSMLDRINTVHDVDVFNFIAAIRTRRIAMVQTEEQYIFIHDAILESNQCGNTEITAVDLRIMAQRLEKNILDSKMTGFEKEWKTLNNVSPIPPKSSCNIATLPENIMKNRSQTLCVLPADCNLVRLWTIEDDEATSYINAVYVDGYKQRNSFILTQSPLKNTVVDFWRMLCEHKSASVVLLCSLDEGDDFVKFWPDAHIREYEMVSVECLSKTRGNEFNVGDRSTAKRGDNELIVRQFKVEDSRYPEFPLMIKLFQYVGWSENKVPSNCTSIIHLINQLERWQQQSGNGPITVVCSDGLGRSGTFAALNAVIERVKIEQVIDVFQAIKAMRIQRAHLVKTLEQYRFIYHAVEEYLNAFDDYANFK